MKRTILFFALIFGFVVNAYSQMYLKPFPVDNYGIRNGLTEIERTIIGENDFEKLKTYYNNVLLNNLEQCATIYQLRFINMQGVGEHYPNNLYNYYKVSFMLYPAYLFFTQFLNNRLFVDSFDKVLNRNDDENDSAFMMVQRTWLNFGRMSIRYAIGEKTRIENAKNSNGITDIQYNTLIKIYDDFISDNSSFFGRFRPEFLELLASQLE